MLLCCHRSPSIQELTRPERFPPGVEVSRLSKAYAKSVVGKSCLCCASASTPRYGIDPAGTGAGCTPTLEAVVDMSDVASVVLTLGADADEDWQLPPGQKRAKMHPNAIIMAFACEPIES